MNKRLTKNISKMIGGVRVLIAFREMFANYGYEEGMKRILAKQIQQTLEREKQPNLAFAVAQSYSNETILLENFLTLFWCLLICGCKYVSVVIFGRPLDL